MHSHAEEIPEISSSSRFRKIQPSDEEQYKQNRSESVALSGLKGLLEGSAGLGEMFGGDDQTSENLKDIYGASQDQLEELKGQRQQLGQESLEKLIPTKEGSGEGIARRAGRMVPGFLAGPGGIAMKIGGIAGGSIAGQLAEESGAGPWGQMASEVVGSVVSGSPSGILKPKPNSRQAQQINTARKYGLSDKEIAPAIQSNRKIGTLGPTAHRGPGTVGKIAQSRSAIGKIYEKLRSSPAGQKIFTSQERSDLINELSSELKNLPHDVRSKILRDAVDLLHSPPNSSSVMNFYQDVNYQIGRGNGHLGGVRRILEKHLTTHLGEDFTLANELFGNVRRLGIKVRPDLASHFHDFRIATDLSEAILHQDKKSIARVITEMMTRFTSSKALTSPYMQHIPRKLLDSAKAGSIEDAKKVLTIMLNKKDESND